MRAFLGGRAIPREEFAIVGIGESSGAPVVLLLEDGEAFIPEDYISLGYTNYEVWCVGASGGRGGFASSTIMWRTMKTQEVMPSDIWADVIHEANLLAAQSSVTEYSGMDRLSDVHMPPVGVNAWEVTGDYVFWRLTPEGLAEFQNWTHTANIIHYLEPIPIDDDIQWAAAIDDGTAYSRQQYARPFLPGTVIFEAPGQQGPMRIGGGGGGGGLHVVHGLLSDLPASLAVEVGQEGADGAPGQLVQPTPYSLAPAWSAATYTRMSQARWDFLYRFPNGRPTIGAPAEGSPGGASSFGDIAKASGGKGGKPGVQWAGSTRQQYAYGGQGGIGGSDIAGGGADGAATSIAPGKDGTWDGAIGKGGGGGRGGSRGYPGYTSDLGMTVPPVPVLEAVEGGRGSLNFADTSVYGARGPKGTYTQTVRKYDPDTGDLISTIEYPIETPINPGSGGGARIPGNRKYGSRAMGYSHDGAVLVRLTKLV